MKSSIKRIVVIVSFVMCALFCNIPVYADTSPIIASGADGSIVWKLDADGLLTISKGPNAGTFLGSMPDYDLITIFQSWHDYCSQVSKIIVEDGVGNIGNMAFYDCSNVTEVSIGNDVAKIGRYAFKCNLTTLSIPASVENIHDSAFLRSRDKTLERFIVSPDNMYYCSDERGVLFDKNKTVLIMAPDRIEGAYTVPDSVVEIITGFEACPNLSELVIPNSVTRMRTDPFEGCDSLENLYIGDGITDLGNVFRSEMCSKLKKLTLGKRITKIGGAIENLSGLEEVNISQENENFISVDNVVYDKEMTTLYAYPRKKTGNYVVPEGITRVNSLAGSLISDITIPDSVVSFGYGCFSGCCTLETINLPSGIEEIVASCFANCINLKEIKIPESVTRIQDNAFKGCQSLTEIIIPEQVQALENKAFQDCDALSTITFKGKAPNFREDVFTGVTATCYYPEQMLSWTEAVRTDYGGNLTWVPYKLNQFESVEYTYTVPDTNVTLGYKVNETSKIASIVVCNLDAVGELYIPEKINEYTVVDIANSAFNGCEGITKVAIASTITEIGDNAFEGCKGLKSVDWGTGVVSIGEYAFSDCKLESIVIPEGVVDIGAYAFFHNYPMTDATLPDSLTYISDYLFARCYRLENVKLPKKITTIGNRAFGECFSLKSMILPEGLETIGSEAFIQCGDTSYTDYYLQFTSVELPSTLKVIGESAFAFCKVLSEIVIPEGVLRIEPYAFSECHSLSSVTIPSTCKYIGDYAFKKGSRQNLNSVTFNWNMPEIHSKAFHNTTTKCYYPANNPEWPVEKMTNYGGTLTWVAKDMEKPEGAGGGSGEGAGEEEGDDSGNSGGSGEGTGEGEGGGSGESGGENNNGDQDSGEGGTTNPPVSGTTFRTSFTKGSGYSFSINKSDIEMDGDDYLLGANETELIQINILEGYKRSDDFKILVNDEIVSEEQWNISEGKAETDKDGNKIAEVIDFAYTPTMPATISVQGVEECGEAAASVYGNSLSLEDSIIINYFLTLPDKLVNEQGAYVMLNDKKILISSLEAGKDKGYVTNNEGTRVFVYKFTYDVVAKQLNEEVILKLYHGNGTLAMLLGKAGEDVTSGYAYSVKAYIDAAKSSQTDSEKLEKLVSLASAIEDYGAYSQIYFDGSTTVTPSQNIASVTAAMLKSYEYSVDRKLSEYIEWAGSTLTLESATKLRHLFKVKTGSIEDFVFEVDGQETEVFQNGSYYVVEIQGIAAKNLNQNHEVKVRLRDTSISMDSFKLIYSPLSYANIALNSEKATPALQDLVKALYLYNKSAINYFN